MKIKLRKHDQITFLNGKTFIAYEDMDCALKGHIVKFNNVPLRVPLGTGPEYAIKIKEAIKRIQKTCPTCCAILVLDESHICHHSFERERIKFQESRKYWSGDKWNEAELQADWEQYLKDRPKEFKRKKIN